MNASSHEMSIFMERQSSSRPYTVGSFGRKLKLFQTYIEEFTHVDEELNPEERRIELQERLTNGTPGGGLIYSNV